MGEIDDLIHYWEITLSSNRLLMNPSSIYFVEQTIKSLQELKRLKGSTE